MAQKKFILPVQRPRFIGKSLYLYSNGNDCRYDFKLPAVCHQCQKPLTKQNTAPIFNNQPLEAEDEEVADHIIALCFNCYETYLDPKPPTLPKLSPAPQPRTNSIVLNGPLVAAARRNLKLSQTTFARIAHVSFGTIQRVERLGRPYFVTQKTTRRLAKALGLATEEIILTTAANRKEEERALEVARAAQTKENLPRDRTRLRHLQAALISLGEKERMIYV